MQPNFVFIIADQLRADHVGFGGNATIKTPHLDGLAKRAMRFDKAYVANPICMPNRATILTGRMPSVHGTRFNGIALDLDAHTFVREMANNGYRTALVGKAHYQNIGDGPTDLVERMFETPGDALTDTHPTGWDDCELHERHTAAFVEMPPDYYGFQQVDLVTHHGDLCSGHYHHWAKEQGFDLTALHGPEKAKQRFAGWQQVYQTAIPEEVYPTRYVAERAKDYLRQAAKADAPFFLQVSFPDPHHPFTPPGRYFEMYDPSDIQLPETFDDPHTNSMPHYQFMHSRRGKVPKMWVAAFAPNESQFRHAAAAEYGMISFIDDAIGEILSTLEDQNLLDNTIVVFTSDHGDMFGDHGIILKAAMHYEGCIRIPLLIAEPNAAGGQTSRLVSSLDLAQTLLDLAGIPEYHGLQGSSLRPLLKDSDAIIHDHLVIEEDEMFDMLFIGKPFRARTLVTEEARLSLYQYIEQGELFDLANDPEEMTNLFATRQDLRAELTATLARELMNLADTSPKPTRMA